MDQESQITDHKASSRLLGKLSYVLPKGYKFGIYHISTPPTRKDPLYAPPPNQAPDKTFCETHFLAISINVPDKSNAPATVLVLALEIFIYTTSFSTTLFVSKADSTGYLHLLGLPKGSPSPIRTVTTAFIEFLVEERRRKDVQFVISLFARAQDQYLFPGSVENKGKHVLDDRSLVKWWCRVVNPIIETPPIGEMEPWKETKAYLVVPGLDRYEMRTLVPRTPKTLENWKFSHPLKQLSQFTSDAGAELPARCLIPSYPDDPKARFRDELDDEAAKSAQFKKNGLWKSVHNIDQFWDMMAYRQECSSGRMTGFLWVVFNTACNRKRDPALQSATPAKSKKISFNDSKKGLRMLVKHSNSKKRRKLTGVIVPREPHIKTHRKKSLLKKPVLTKFYAWPMSSRGEIIVDDADYKQIYELLLRLDFANLAIAQSSSARWISEVGGGKMWGAQVVGEAEEKTAENGKENGAANVLLVNNLSGLVKRKRQDSESKVEAPVVNVLSAGSVRKKPKN
ncbi:hypothetical protein TD95_002124 [Thielaviopsis punctulata]|uniref:histone acetyltransferase n=1 Tax=Thielaviopsis punctulata TaxID=72032 RepID=A0A0F4Z975_9PEZI|nr:hypothetical protein TD95_002124 [Thielaviopsis punctulata]